MNRRTLTDAACEKIIAAQLPLLSHDDLIKLVRHAYQLGYDRDLIKTESETK